MTRIWAGFFIFALLSVASEASEVEWELDPLVIEAAPPAAPSGIPETAATAFSTVGYGKTAGSLTQFRGLGRSADDTRVESLGVPLNLPQGGGFDLSSFPGYLWTRQRFSIAPAPGAFDPRAIAGRLALDPWVGSAVAGQTSRFRLTQEFSGDGALETSVAVAAGVEHDKPGFRGAALAGVTTGEVTGQAGSGALRWRTGRGTHEVYFLGARTRVKSPGSLAYPTPLAETESRRLIPIVRSEIQVDEGLSLSATAHADTGSLRYDDPGSGFGTFDRFDRMGGDLAVRDASGWTLGGDLALSRYSPGAVASLAEGAGSLRVSRRISLAGGQAALEPTARVAGVSGAGILPEGGAAFSARPTHELSVFANAAFSRRHPTMTDRYYVVPGFFRGNPALRPERDWTFLVGAEASRGIVSTSLQGWLQLRDGVHLNVTDSTGPKPLTTVENAGGAQVASLIHGLRVAPVRQLELDGSLVVSGSRVARTGLSYPYLPAVAQLTGATFRPGPPQGIRWEFRAAVRSAGRAVADDLGHELPGHSQFDLEVGALIPHLYDFKGKLSLSVENLFDRKVQTAWGYPPLGRTASLLLIGEI